MIDKLDTFVSPKNLDNPLISIVMPTYNTGELLRITLNSILAQSYNNWELFVVDDISTDNTRDIVKDYAVDKRINYIERFRGPKGAQTCRNIGFERCNGKYVVFFDSDDLFSPDCLKQRVMYMEKNPHLDFGVFPASTFAPNQEVNDVTKPKWGIRNDNESPFISLLKANYQFIVVTNIYKHAFLKNNNIFWDENVKVYQDFDYNFRVFQKHPKYDFCEQAEIDYFYRVNYSSTSITSNYVSDEKCESTLILFSNVLKALSLKEDGPKLKRYFFSFIFLHYKRLLNNNNKVQIIKYNSFIAKYYPFHVRLRCNVALCLISLLGLNRITKIVSISLFRDLLN